MRVGTKVKVKIPGTTDARLDVVVGPVLGTFGQIVEGFTKLRDHGNVPDDHITVIESTFEMKVIDRIPVGRVVWMLRIVSSIHAQTKRIWEHSLCPFSSLIMTNVILRGMEGHELLIRDSQGYWSLTEKGQKMLNMMSGMT